MIKHLTPRPEKEVKTFLKTLSHNEKLIMGANQCSIQLIKEAVNEGVDEMTVATALGLTLINQNLECSEFLLETGIIKHEGLIKSAQQCINTLKSMKTK
jgi:hypothetical protein